MSDELKVIPFYGLGGLQSRGEAVNAAIQANFEQIYKALNEIKSASAKKGTSYAKK
jgi:hypothetical protein